MTYGYCRDAALKLINQYSIAGTVIAASYNNQYDYIKRIPELINDALLLIATSALPIEDSFVPSAVTDLGEGWVCFDMPDNFIRLTGRGLPKATPAGPVFVKNYRMVTNRRMAIRSEELAGVTVTYCRAPAKITADSADNTELDMPDWAAGAVPYYVASHLVIGDDSFLYATLLNEFEARLERMRAPTDCEACITEDEYGLDGVYGVY